MERAIETFVVLSIFFFGGVTILVLPKPYKSPELQFKIVESPSHLDMDKRVLRMMGTANTRR